MTVRPKREITGRVVLLSLIGFFAVVAGVNAVMIFAAVSTFGGVETGRSYKAGLAFATDLKAATAQDDLHWQVQVNLTPQSGHQRIRLHAFDAKQQALSGVSAIARFSHPTDRRADIVVELLEVSAGRYDGIASPAAGQWDLIVELTRDGHRLFRSKSRLIIKSL